MDINLYIRIRICMYEFQKEYNILYQIIHVTRLWLSLQYRNNSEYSTNKNEVI